MSNVKKYMRDIFRLLLYGTTKDIRVIKADSGNICNTQLNTEFFKNDSLNRKEIAENWTNRFLKTSYSKIITIDADWGMGKTYFATNWANMLKYNKYQVCYIDAFEYDFTDDPFMVISHSIIETLKKNNNFTELENISNYLSMLFKAFKSNTIDAFPTIAEGCTISLCGITNKSLANGLGKITNSVINILKDGVHNANNASHNPFDSIKKDDIAYIHVVKAFKKLLGIRTSKIVEETKKPLIVIVDELDRCKPTFAIEFLEKLKHVFDINNIVFILFINHNELSNAVKGMYGQSFDGKKYLDKFFSIKLTFPKLYSDSSIYTEFIRSKMEEKLCLNILNVKNFFDVENILFPTNAVDSIISIIKLFQNIYGLSLRNIESIIETLKYIGFRDDRWEICFYIIFRILYIFNIEFYNEFRNLDKKIIDIEDKMQTYNKVIKLNEKQPDEYKTGYEIFIQFFFLYEAAVVNEENNSKYNLPPYDKFPRDYFISLRDIVESICQ